MNLRMGTLATVSGLVLAACTPAPRTTPERQAEVAARGAEVMPFDLDRTRHHFEDLPDGGSRPSPCSTPPTPPTFG